MSFGRPPETQTPAPLIKRQVQSGRLLFLREWKVYVLLRFRHKTSTAEDRWDRPQFASGLCRQKADKRVRNVHKEVNAMMNSEHHHDHTDPPSELALRVRALESLLVEKGLVDPAAIDVLIDTYETRIGPRNGAKVVARAWSDAAFKQWLLEDATAAMASMGYSGLQGEHMKVVENTPKIHNLVVCTLCSCYPWPVLGLPPVWYKSAPYRARAVADPRGVLKEFGTELREDIEIRVWDSTSEIRFLVLPARPQGTEGWSEEELAALVTRNAMIGVETAKSPKDLGRK